MGFARACSVALVGVEGVVVEVQADLEPGVAAFTLVGLPDKTLVESRDRVRAAVVNSGASWPQKKLTVGLSPASVPKSGAWPTWRWRRPCSVPPRWSTRAPSPIWS